MGEETNAYDPAGSQFDDDVTAERPTDRAAQSGQKAQATARAAEPVKPLISMSDLPDLRNTFNPNAPLDDSNDLSRDEFTTVYDIIDSIEEELDEAKPILFAPSSVRVDRESFTGKLDKLKKMLPVQLERASALMRESERRLESAQTQANAIIASAQSRAADTVREANEQAQFLAGQENVTELARQKARGILDQAQAKADKAPRVTPAALKDEIVSEHYFTAADGARMSPDGNWPIHNLNTGSLGLLTFCVLVLRNGFTVYGASACASPENFDAEIGRRIARENAEREIWPLLGFRLRDELAR